MRILQEVLMALAGHPGDLFVLAEDGMQCSDDGGLNDSEKASLDRVVCLGSHYVKLNEWCDRQRSGSASRYRRAVASCISNILEHYRSCILSIEQECLQEPSPNLMRIESSLGVFKQILPKISSLLSTMEKDNLSGGELVRFLHNKYRATGDLEFRESVREMMWHSLQVIYRQIAAWVVHGVLWDPHGEFFIQPVRRSSVGQEEGRSPGPDFASHRVSVKELPPRIELQTAEAVLSTGQSVRILKETESVSHLGGLVGNWVEKDFQNALEEMAEKRELDPFALSRCVESVRMKVANRLWEVVVQRNGLLRHLRAMRDYFFASRGDFFLAFLEEARPLLQLPPTANRTSGAARAAVSNAFTQAALKTGVNEDPPFNCFATRLADPSEASESESGGLYPPRLDEWDRLGLKYEAEHPLNLVLDDGALRRYEAVYKCLLRLKRAEVALEEAWVLLKRRRRGNSASLLDIMRHEMAFFIQNWLGYLQNDVIAPLHQGLLRRVRSSSDFRDLVDAHESFLSAVLSQSLLDVPSIQPELEGCLSCCMWLHRRVLDTGAQVDVENARSAWSKFRQHVASLRGKLSDRMLQNSGRAPALRQFLLRLNFNGFLDRL